MTTTYSEKIKKMVLAIAVEMMLTIDLEGHHLNEEKRKQYRTQLSSRNKVEVSLGQVESNISDSVSAENKELIAKWLAKSIETNTIRIPKTISQNQELLREYIDTLLQKVVDPNLGPEIIQFTLASIKGAFDLQNQLIKELRVENSIIKEKNERLSHYDPAIYKKKNADKFAESLVPPLKEALANGTKSQAGIARYFNSKGLKTYTGVAFGQSSVRDIIKRQMDLGLIEKSDFEI